MVNNSNYKLSKHKATYKDIYSPESSGRIRKICGILVSLSCYLLVDNVTNVIFCTLKNFH